MPTLADWNSLGFRGSPEEWDAFFGEPVSWRNIVRFTPLEGYLPEGAKDNALDIRTALGDAANENFRAAWNDYAAYLTNQMMWYMNPIDARTIAMQLASTAPEPLADYWGAMTSDETSTDRMGNPNMFELNPVFGTRPGGEADRYYNSAAKWDAILEGLNYANYQLFGDIDDTTWSDDPGLDPFESQMNWIRQVANLGKQYGLSDDRRRLNRYELSNLSKDWELLAQGSFDPNLSTVFERLLFPEQYATAGSPVEFRLFGGREPSTSSYGSRWAYRSPYMT